MCNQSIGLRPFLPFDSEHISLTKITELRRHKFDFGGTCSLGLVQIDTLDSFRFVSEFVKETLPSLRLDCCVEIRLRLSSFRNTFVSKKLILVHKTSGFFLRNILVAFQFNGFGVLCGEDLER